MAQFKTSSQEASANHGSITMTARQREVLTLLSNSDHWSVGQIASALGVSSAAATKAIVRLERKGLVKRSENTIDRRRVDVSLTRIGTKTARPARLFLESDRSD